MCGRFTYEYTWQEIHDLYQLTLPYLQSNLQPSWNVCPTQTVPIVRRRSEDGRVAEMARWGLIPFWCKDLKEMKLTTINAKAETLRQSKLYAQPFEKRRCIVPANGFMEWKALEKGKQPYYIHAANDALFGLAGLWERWSPPDGEAIDTFTIVTTSANAAVRDLHDRMPVILAPENFGRWLDQQTPLDEVQPLVAPCPDAVIAMHPVSRAVGNVKNDEPGLIEPVLAG